MIVLVELTWVIIVLHREGWGAVLLLLLLDVFCGCFLGFGLFVGFGAFIVGDLGLSLFGAFL